MLWPHSAIFQLERDTIQTFYDITKKEVSDLNLAISAKDKEMETMEQNHRVEIRVYIQKVMLRVRLLASCAHSNQLCLVFAFVPGETLGL